MRMITVFDACAFSQRREFSRIAIGIDGGFITCDGPFLVTDGNDHSSLVRGHAISVKFQLRPATLTRKIIIEKINHHTNELAYSLSPILYVKDEAVKWHG